MRRDGRQVGGDRVDDRHEVGPDDEHLGLGVVDDVLDLGRSEPPVDVDADRVEERRAEEDLEVFDAVLVEERDAVLRSDTLGGECLSGLRGAVTQLGPGERPIVLDECRVIRTVGAMDPDDVGKAADVVPHARQT